MDQQVKSRSRGRGNRGKRERVKGNNNNNNNNNKNNNNSEQKVILEQNEFPLLPNAKSIIPKAPIQWGQPKPQEPDKPKTQEKSQQEKSQTPDKPNPGKKNGGGKNKQQKPQQKQQKPQQQKPQQQKPQQTQKIQLLKREQLPSNLIPPELPEEPTQENQPPPEPAEAELRPSVVERYFNLWLFTSNDQTKYYPLGHPMWYHGILTTVIYFMKLLSDEDYGILWHWFNDHQEDHRCQIMLQVSHLAFNSRIAFEHIY